MDGTDDTGVSTHSSPNKKYIVFSVFTGSRLDLASHKCMLDLLVARGITYKELDGTYKGFREKSILIHEKYYALIRDVLRDTYEQESVLILSNHRHGLYKAQLDYLRSNRIVDIGYLRSVPEHIAILQESSTYDPEQDKYFIVTQSDETRLDKLNEVYFRKVAQ